MHYHTPPTPPTPSQANTTALGPLWLLVCHHIPLLHFGISFIHFSAHTFLKIFHVLSTYPPGACVPFLRHCLQPSETVWGSARRLRFFSDSRVTLIRHDDGEYGSESLETPMAFHDTGIGMDMTALVFLWAGNEYYRLGITGTRERKAKVGLRLHKNLIFFSVLLYTLVFFTCGHAGMENSARGFFFFHLFIRYDGHFTSCNTRWLSLSWGAFILGWRISEGQGQETASGSALLGQRRKGKKVQGRHTFLGSIFFFVTTWNWEERLMTCLNEQPPICMIHIPVARAATNSSRFMNSHLLPLLLLPSMRDAS